MLCTFSVALRLPFALGVNDTAIWHEPPGATGEVQWFTAAKSEGLVPLIFSLLITSGVNPTLLTKMILVVVVPTLCGPKLS